MGKYKEQTNVVTQWLLKSIKQQKSNKQQSGRHKFKPYQKVGISGFTELASYKFIVWSAG